MVKRENIRYERVIFRKEEKRKYSYQKGYIENKYYYIMFIKNNK